MSLANKYRPHTFEDVVGQESTIKILTRQVELEKYPNCYLFCGPTGTGKTTIARILATEINKHSGTPIEMDAASNNSVDNVREIIDHAYERALDSEYRINIIDEAHMITTAGWNAFLKCIEEPPKYTIFMFCTTNPEKLPATISNRLMRFNLAKIPNSKINERLIDICNKESLKFDNDGIDYITKMSDGGMRDAIANLEKVANYSNDINLDNCLTALGGVSDIAILDLLYDLTDGNSNKVLSFIEDSYYKGVDLKQLVDQLIHTSLDISKYCLFNKNISMTSIPSSYEKRVNEVAGIRPTLSECGKAYNELASKFLTLKYQLKNCTNIKDTIEVVLLSLC